MTTSEQPIADAIARDDYRKALEWIAKLYAKPIGRYCRLSLGRARSSESDELLQEIMLASHRALPTFAGRSSVKTWLFSIARRHIGRAIKRNANQAELVELSESTLQQSNPASAPDELLAAARRKRQLQRALAQLTEKQRDVIVLRYVGDLSYREIATICDIEEDTARQRAASGLRALRRLLTEAASPKNGVHSTVLRIGENTP
jgi:RNA polymerase sigma factor (sigma-70 family)